MRIRLAHQIVNGDKVLGAFIIHYCLIFEVGIVILGIELQGLAKHRDYESAEDLIAIYNLMGKSYSHTFQIDASYPLLKGLEITAAYRLNDVKCTYDYGKSLMEKPLTSKYKALFTASYKTPLGLWQFDATVQLNGGGRNPEPYQLADGSQSWSPRFHSFEQVSAQVTRWFRHWSIYVGGENLTGFKQKTPIYGASNPWGSDFEPTLVWGPVEGRMFYAGVRVHF